MPKYRRVNQRRGRANARAAIPLGGNGCGRVDCDGPSGAGCPHAVSREEPQARDGLIAVRAGLGVARVGFLAVAVALGGLVLARVGFLAVAVVPAELVLARAGSRAA